MPSRNTPLFAAYLFFGVVLVFAVAGHVVAAGEQADGNQDPAAPPAEAAARRPPQEAEAAARDETLQSQEMLEAILWLEQYYATSADSSDQQRAALAGRLERMTATELRWFLLDFQRQRVLALQQQIAFDNQRAQTIAGWQDYRQRQEAANRAASRAGSGSLGQYYGTAGRQYRGAGGRVRRHSRGTSLAYQSYLRVHGRALGALAASYSR